MFGDAVMVTVLGASLIAFGVANILEPRRTTEWLNRTLGGDRLPYGLQPDPNALPRWYGFFAAVVAVIGAALVVWGASGIWFAVVR